MPELDPRRPPADPALVLCDEWVGASEPALGVCPADWREVAAELAWDVATVAAGWVWFEACQRPFERWSVRARLEVLARTLAADLPFWLGVGPSAPDGAAQPQLALWIPEDPPLEPLARRPAELSWRLYFDLQLERSQPTLLSRARADLRRIALAELGAPVDGVEDDAWHGAVEGVLGAGAARWVSLREQEDRRLARSLCDQLAAQVEWLLRDQVPTLMALVEESIALAVEDAARGAAMHVRVDDARRPEALVLVTWEGQPRTAVPISVPWDARYRDLLAVVGWPPGAPDPRGPVS